MLSQEDRASTWMTATEPSFSAKKDMAMEKFQEHFVNHRNVIFERAKFNNRKQEPGEAVDNFITSRYALADHCTLYNEMLRDRIVVGIQESRSWML